MKKKFFLVIGFFFILYLTYHIYFFDRYFIYNQDETVCITYLRKGKDVYIIPYRYLRKNIPKENYLKFDRSNYSNEMNYLMFYSDSKINFKRYIFYDNGVLEENKLNGKTLYYKTIDVFEKEKFYNPKYLTYWHIQDNNLVSSILYSIIYD